MSARKKKLNGESSLELITKSIGYKLTLPSGKEFHYEDSDDEDNQMQSLLIQSEDLEYFDGTSVCDDVVAIAINATDEAFEEIIKDLREIRKVHHNFNIDRGYL